METTSQSAPQQNTGGVVSTQNPQNIGETPAINKGSDFQAPVSPAEVPGQQSLQVTQTGQPIQGQPSQAAGVPAWGYAAVFLAIALVAAVVLWRLARRSGRRVAAAGAGGRAAEPEVLTNVHFKPAKVTGVSMPTVAKAATDGPAAAKTAAVTKVKTAGKKAKKKSAKRKRRR